MARVAAFPATRSSPVVLPPDRSSHLGHILVVDDSDVTHSLVHDLLARAAYTSTHVISAAAAVQAVRWYTFDAVILDVLAPGVDAGELAARLREVAGRPDLPLIFYSSLYGKAETEEKALLLHPAFTVAKDGDVTNLARTVDRAIAACA